jgi:hypothetical protein
MPQTELHARADEGKGPAMAAEPRRQQLLGTELGVGAGQGLGG